MRRMTCVLVIAMCLVTPVLAQETIVDTFEVQKDAFVDVNFPANNYGEMEFLTLFNEGADVKQSIFLRFDFSEIFDSLEVPVVEKATLVLDATHGPDPAEAEFITVLEDWDETTISYNNMPEVDTNDVDTILLDNSVVLLKDGGMYDLNIVDKIRRVWSEMLFNIWIRMILGVSPNPDDISFDFKSGEYMREFNAYPAYEGPMLILEYHYAAVEEDGVEPAVNLNVSPLSRGSAIISYSLAGITPASLKIFDASGALMETFQVEPGNHSITYDGSPGIYFMRLQTPGEVITKKAVILN